MPPTNKERYRNFGYRIFVRPLDAASLPLMDIGETGPDAVTGAREKDRLDSFDERGGSQQLSRTRVTRTVDRFTVKSRNHDANLRRLFEGAAAPTTLTQTNTAVSNQVYSCAAGIVGYYIELILPAGHPQAGQRAFNVSSVVVTGPSATPTYVAGTDYVLDAVKGILFIPANSGITPGNIEVDYTPGTMAVTGGRIAPQTLVAGVEAYVEIWKIHDNGNQQLARIIPRARIEGGTGDTAGAAVENEYDLELTVLTDPTSATPAGELLDVKQ